MIVCKDRQETKSLLGFLSEQVGVSLLRQGKLGEKQVAGDKTRVQFWTWKYKLPVETFSRQLDMSVKFRMKV